jgi:hypothetical protein
LAAKVKDRSRTLYARGDCASAEGIGCGVDCDGGGIGIEPLAGGDDAILVRLERIRMTLGCCEGEEVELEGGAEDKVFKLIKAPRPMCDSCKQAPTSRCNDSRFRVRPYPPWRSRTATKKPSVPWLRGVIWSVSAEPSAEGAAAAPGKACAQISGQGMSLNSG